MQKYEINEKQLRGIIDIYGEDLCSPLYAVLGDGISIGNTCIQKDDRKILFDISVKDNDLYFTGVDYNTDTFGNAFVFVYKLINNGCEKASTIAKPIVLEINMIDSYNKLYELLSGNSSILSEYNITLEEITLPDNIEKHISDTANMIQKKKNRIDDIHYYNNYDIWYHNNGKLIDNMTKIEDSNVMATLYDEESDYPSRYSNNTLLYAIINIKSHIIRSYENRGNNIYELSETLSDRTYNGYFITKYSKIDHTASILYVPNGFGNDEKTLRYTLIGIFSESLELSDDNDNVINDNLFEIEIDRNIIKTTKIYF